MRQNFLRKQIALIGILGLQGGLWISTLRRAHAQSQEEMDRSADSDYRTADARMNIAYGKLIARLGTTQKARLKTAQLAWIKFRDAETLFLSSKAEGGSVSLCIPDEKIAPGDRFACKL